MLWVARPKADQTRRVRGGTLLWQGCGFRINAAERRLFGPGRKCTVRAIGELASSVAEAPDSPKIQKYGRRLSRAGAPIGESSAPFSAHRRCPACPSLSEPRGCFSECCSLGASLARCIARSVNRADVAQGVVRSVRRWVGILLAQRTARVLRALSARCVVGSVYCSLSEPRGCSGLQVVDAPQPLPASELRWARGLGQPAIQ